MGDGSQGCGQVKGQALYSFGSIDCTEESLAQAFNKWKEHGADFYAGKPRSVWAQLQGRLNAVIRGVRMEKAWMAREQGHRVYDRNCQTD